MSRSLWLVSSSDAPESEEGTIAIAAHTHAPDCKPSTYFPVEQAPQLRPPFAHAAIGKPGALPAANIPRYPGARGNE